MNTTGTGNDDDSNDDGNGEDSSGKSRTGDRGDHARGGFARWLLRQYRLAGHDRDPHHDPDGTEAHAHIAAHERIVVIAAIALDTGLTPELTAELAHTLAVPPQDITTAYLTEARRRTLDRILDHPGLAELDRHLDHIARG